jgi:glycerol-3-phosphate acyltransferase PlsX
VTAGNTGAAMASAKMVLGALPGVDRPALAMPLPTTSGSPCVLLDVGANVDCNVRNLAQFAIMGEMYARSVLLIEKPRVGLLSIGEEETKGNELTREALQVLKQLPIRFIGNVEGRDLYNGHADVIVCDGFVGNVALKTSEGLGRMVREMLRESLMSTVSGRAGALLAAASKSSRSASTSLSMAARRCWGCADPASSRTAQRTIARSSTASAWRRSLLRPE